MQKMNHHDLSIVALFLRLMTCETHPEFEVSYQDLYTNYVTFCSRYRFQSVKRRAFIEYVNQTRKRISPSFEGDQIRSYGKVARGIQWRETGIYDPRFVVIVLRLLDQSSHNDLISKPEIDEAIETLYHLLSMEPTISTFYEAEADTPNFSTFYEALRGGRKE